MDLAGRRTRQVRAAGCPGVREKVGSGGAEVSGKVGLEGGFVKQSYNDNTCLSFKEMEH